MVSVIVLVAFGLLLYILATQQIPLDNRETLRDFTNVLGTLAVADVSYWVGSSAGSLSKNLLLARKSE